MVLNHVGGSRLVHFRFPLALATDATTKGIAMTPIHELKAKRAEHIRKAKAIQDGAKAVGRENDEKELAIIDAEMTAVDKIDAEITATEAAQKRAQQASRIDALASSLTSETGRRSTPDQNANEQRATDAVRSFTIPAEAKRWGSANLTSFKGPNAEYKAYGFGQWLCWSLKGSKRAGQWLAQNGIIDMHAAQSESSNSAGGDLVPDEYVPDMIRLVEEYGVFRRNARVRPMTREVLELPRRTGGLTAYFTSEATADSATAITKSSVATAKHRLVAQKLATYTLESVELAEDAAVSMGDLVAQEIAQAFANKEDECGFNGTGTSTYGGIQGVISFAGSASIVTAATGNTGFETLDNDDFAAAIGKLPRYALNGAKWYISSFGWAASMMRLAANAGGNTIQNLGGGFGLSYLGFPVEISQVLNSTAGAQASVKYAVFGNLSLGCTFGDRRSVTVEMDKSRHFDTDQVAIKGTERFDIACHTFDSTSAAGPVIVLKFAAS